MPLPTIPNMANHADALSISRFAMHELDQWIESTEKALIGRKIKVTQGRNAGTTETVTGIGIDIRGHSGARVQLAVNRLYRYELGFSCELLERE